MSAMDAIDHLADVVSQIERSYVAALRRAKRAEEAAGKEKLTLLAERYGAQSACTELQREVERLRALNTQMRIALERGMEVAARVASPNMSCVLYAWLAEANEALAPPQGGSQ
jgi:DNA-binding transcriptional regulator YbjK